MKWKYKYILALDPSGNFTEGKGTTGWVLLSANEQLLAKGHISAKKYNCAEEYWDEHIALIKYYHNKYEQQLIVVIEDYILYKNRSKNQTNSKIETCRLLGVLQHYCWRIKQDYSMQLAATVKTRWSDDILLHEGILYKRKSDLIHKKSGLFLSLEHTRDAFRHAIHYAVCRNHTKERNRRNYGNAKQSNY